MRTVAGAFLDSVFLIALGASHAVAEGVPFSADCKDVKTVAYRNASAFEPKWSDEEKFSGGPWKVVYDGDDYISIDGHRLPIVAQNGHSLIAVQLSTTGIAVSTWAYVINLKIREMAAAQVNSYSDSLSSGVKARSVQFDCQFTFSDVN